MTKKYNYKQLSLILDPEVKDENDIYEWMKKYRSKKFTYSDMLKKAMTEYIKKQKKKKINKENQ